MAELLMPERLNRSSAAQQQIVTAVEIGGTRTRYGLVQDGQLIGNPWEDNTPSRYAGLRGLIRRASVDVLGGERPDVVGISAAGVVSRDQQLVAAGELQARGYVGQPIVDDVAEATGLKPGGTIIMLDDCATGEFAELMAQRKKMGVGPTDQVDEDRIFATLSTGFGIAIGTREGWIVLDPAGHRFLRSGAICGDKQDGHIEAWISGSGIARNRNHGVPAEKIDHKDPKWLEIKQDFHAAMDNLLAIYQKAGLNIGEIAWTGSLALKGPDMLEDLQQHLNKRADSRKSPVIRITKAVHGENNGLLGAGQAAELTHNGARPYVVYDGIKAIKGLRAIR
jgi:predicted NBD/HSP70 family sugar kinase